MKITRTTLLALVMMSIAVWAFPAEIIVPVAGTAPGAGGSNWQTELTLHNAGIDPATITLTFHDSLGPAESATVTLMARETLTIEDVVQTEFGRSNATGAIVLSGDDLAIGKLVVSARIFTGAGGEEFGQDVPSYLPSRAAFPGDTAVIAGPGDPFTARFNFGVFAIEESVVDWILVRANGEEAGTFRQSLSEGAQYQHNGGVTTLFGENPEPSDVVYARVVSGRVITYGSVANNTTNDPSFVPFSRTRENLGVVFLGLDLDEDGDIDVSDADGDNVLDSRIFISTRGIPTFFRVVVTDPEGRAVTLSVSGTYQPKLVDNLGTIQWLPGASERGTTGDLYIRASDGFRETTITIPVQFE